MYMCIVYLFPGKRRILISTHVICKRNYVDSVQLFTVFILYIIFTYVTSLHCIFLNKHLWGYVTENKTKNSTRVKEFCYVEAFVVDRCLL
jgi:hypothetical protein